jgi:DNA invertase Pin-like site-specific DNA recombinase
VEGIDRPAFFELLNFLEPGDCVVAERMDRLARELMTSEILLKECRIRGIKVFCADRGTPIDVASDGADATVVLIRQVLAAVAEFDKTCLVRKLRAAKDRMKAKGLYAEGKRHYGHYPGEDFILRVMLDNSASMNYTRLAELLNSSDCRTRSGTRWTPQNVRSILVDYRKRNKI